MSSRTPRPPGRVASTQPEPEDSYPHIPEPKQGHSGLVLAFLSVLAVLGFGAWTAVGTLASSNEKPAAAKPAATGVATKAAVANPTALPTVQATAAPTTGPAASPTPAGGTRVHTVAQGDTLFGIAQRYKTTVDAIMAANKITDRSHVLHIGDKLIIP